MQEISGGELHGAIRILEQITCDFKHVKPQGDSSYSLRPVAVILRPGERERAGEALRQVERVLRESGLNTSGEAAMELVAELTAYKAYLAVRLVSRIEEIQRTIQREMKTVLFLYINPERAKWYKAPRAGWEDVIKRFPNAISDIEESARCLACDRYAATVFHLMLVAEVGAIEVGKLIQVNDPKPGWPSTIREMNRIVHRAKHQDLRPVEQKYRNLLGQLLPMMESMQDGWRHKISHVDNKLVLLSGEFSPQIAEEILIATRAFMRRLATELP